MRRRDFLRLTLATALLASCRPGWRGGKLGLALGAGGARGLAHVPMLEVLDERKLRPALIAGSSIGAVIGAMYAAGMSGRKIRGLIDRITVSGKESLLGSLFESGTRHWWSLIEIELGNGGLVDTDPFIEFLLETIGVTSFEQLEIPLQIVATDFWRREPVVFREGPLAPAIQASIAIPGLFSPVHHRGRVLVDGGLVDPVPWGLLLDKCETVVAIDVSGNRTPESADDPGYFEILFNTIQIMQASIIRQQLEHRPPQIYIHPALENIRVLDFDRVDEIYAQAAGAALELGSLLGN